MIDRSCSLYVKGSPPVPSPELLASKYYNLVHCDLKDKLH